MNRAVVLNDWDVLVGVQVPRLVSMDTISVSHAEHLRRVFDDFVCEFFTCRSEELRRELRLVKPDIARILWSLMGRFKAPCALLARRRHATLSAFYAPLWYSFSKLYVDTVDLFRQFLTIAITSVVSYTVARCFFNSRQWKLHHWKLISSDLARLFCGATWLWCKLPLLRLRLLAALSPWVCWYLLIKYVDLVDLELAHWCSMLWCNRRR